LTRKIFILTNELVTIGIPTFERPEMLRRALDCAVNQTYTNLEILISDNASTNPHVSEVVEEFITKDIRIKYHKQVQNLGVLANIEYLIKWAEGDFFTIFSDDDWRAPEFIELLKAKLDSAPKCLFAFCNYIEVNQSGTPEPGYPSSHLDIFKPFESAFKWYRVAVYYFQDAKKGKPNLFYGLFRYSAIAALDLRKISGGFKHLNMDCLISYLMLKKSPVIIVEELLCTLTCGNKKYYSKIDLDKKRYSLTRFFSFYSNDKKTYQDVSDNFIESLLIATLFWIKIIYLIVSFLNNKLLGVIHLLNKNSEKSIQKKLDKKIDLPMITLVAMASVDVEGTVNALKYSCTGINFGEVKLLSHYTPFNLDSSIKFHKISYNTSTNMWCEKIIYDLHKYISTDYIILIHADGFIVNPDMWREEFLDYDYIGAPWPLPKDKFSYRDIDGNIVRIGNSVSLRSKKILMLPTQLDIPWDADHGYFHEDGFLCVQNRHTLLQHGIKYAPMEVAKYFSHEIMIPEIKNIKPFAFHKWAGSNSIYPKF